MFPISRRFALFLFSLLGTYYSAGVCNETEKAIWADNPSFAAKISKFAVLAVGRSAGVVERLVQTYPALSEDCAGCFGEAVACGTKNCFFSCIRSSTSPDCVSCSQKHCTPSLMECIGVSNASELPPPPVPVSETSTTTRMPRTRKLAAPNELLDMVEIVFGEGRESYQFTPNSDYEEPADSTESGFSV
jgi:hypothetical protein